MPQEQDIELAGDLAGALREVIQGLPGLQWDKSGDSRRSTSERPVSELELNLQVAGRPIRMLVHTRRSSSARELREVARRLKCLVDSDADIPSMPLIAAQRISMRGREFLREQGLGYWDLGGSFYLQLPWAVYWIDRPPLPVGPRKRREVFQGRSAQVFHTLLLEPERLWHLNELAHRSETSSYIALQACSYLEEQFWMVRQGKGPRVVRHLVEPAALLDAWAEAHSLDRYEFRRYYRWAQSPAALREAVALALESAGVDYALTLASGAELVAPFATGVERLTFLIPEGVSFSEVAQAANLRPVDSGDNVAFLITRERAPLLFRQRHHNLWVASNVQLYLDLHHWPQRGREQARHLRLERLPY